MKHIKKYIDRTHITKRTSLLKECFKTEDYVKATVLKTINDNISTIDEFRAILRETKLPQFERWLNRGKNQNFDTMLERLAALTMNEFFIQFNYINNGWRVMKFTDDQLAGVRKSEVVRKLRNCVSHTKNDHKGHLQSIYNNNVKGFSLTNDPFADSISYVRHVEKLLK